jgi:hypothetical protein
VVAQLDDLTVDYPAAFVRAIQGSDVIPQAQLAGFFRMWVAYRLPSAVIGRVS